MGERSRNNFDDYRAAKKEIDDDTREWIAAASQRAYDYGVMAVKNILLVSGGALLAIPAISGLSDKLEPEIAASAGMRFAIAVGLSVLCIYVIHINWLSHFHFSIWDRQKRVKQVWETYMPETEWGGASDAELEKKREVSHASGVFYVLCSSSAGNWRVRILCTGLFQTLSKCWVTTCALPPPSSPPPRDSAPTTPRVACMTAPPRGLVDE